MRLPVVARDESNVLQPWVVKDGERIIHRSATWDGANSIATNVVVIQQINAESAF
jgi:hypothetical protein